ncbi:MAG: DUF4238 domain-containing protein, partial [Nitrospirota bacterium]|nr:DUF4238 domain-containing protein [Nitrospirota bacterium]
MSVNSHFIPQFLLKGFAFRQKGGQAYVHVFRKGCAPFSPNTKGVAAPRNFYGDETVEQTLAVIETQFSMLVQRLREGDCASNTKPLIDRFV